MTAPPPTLPTGQQILPTIEQPSPDALYLEVSANLGAAHYIRVAARAIHTLGRIATALEASNALAQATHQELATLNRDGIPTLMALSGELSDRSAAEVTKGCTAALARLDSTIATLDRLADAVALLADRGR